MSTTVGVELPPDVSALEFTGERFDPSLSGEIVHEHLHRYLFAQQFCAGKDVLDIASGEGYGSFLLSRVARHTIGVDISTAAVEHARRRYGGETLEYRSGSCTSIPLPDASIDVLVSFETIEHFEGHEAFLGEIERVLRPDGLLVMSSPDKRFYSPEGKPPNPFHVKELTADEFKALIERHFPNATYGLQKATSGSLLLPEAGALPRMECFARAKDGSFARHAQVTEALYVVTIASRRQLPDVTWGMLDDAGYPEQLRARTDVVQTEATRLEGVVAALTRESATARLDAAAARAQADAARAEANAAQQQAAASRAEADALREELISVGNSRSWKLTRPLREAAALARTLRDTRSLRAVVRQGGKLVVDALPATPREKVRALKRKVAEAKQQEDLSRGDPDGPRVAGALKRILHDLTASGADSPVTHIVVVPFLKSGGADLVAANYLRFLAEQRGPGSCLLVVADSPQLTVPEWLPPGVRTVRIDDFIDQPTWPERVDILQGIVVSTGARVVHNVNSVAGWNLIIHRGGQLTPRARFFGSIFAFQYDPAGALIGYAAEFFERARPHLSGLLTDNRRFAEDLARQYALDDAWRSRIHVVYNPSRALETALAGDRADAQAKDGPMRVLWAGRIDAEKLPDVLQAVADRSSFATFDVFGSAVVDTATPALVASARLRLRGPFQSVPTLFEGASYDAFVFTSKWEGLPNILLEVGAYGVPIVAPDVGGIAELVSEDTGYLVSGARDVDGYVAALDAIRRDPAEAARRARRLSKLVRERHTWESFATSMRRISDYV